MPYRDLETVGWIVREEIAPEEVRSAFERAIRELAAAKEINCSTQRGTAPGPSATIARWSSLQRRHWVYHSNLW